MKRRVPLALQVLIGVALGIVLGVTAGKGELTETLGAIGILSIKALRALAVPLVFFAILDAFVKTRIEARKFGRLMLICLVNVSVAMAIGLTLLNVFQPGKLWRGKLETLIAQTHAKAPEAKKVEDPEAPGATLELLPNVSYYVPSSLVRPFVYNNLISVVLLALLIGAAIRKVRAEQEALSESTEQSIRTIESFIAAAYQVMLVMLEWIVRTVPYAVFGTVAKVVGASGVGVFALLWVFLLVALTGLALHSLVYYPAIAYFWGKKSPKVYLGQGADAILTGLSTNSSLASVPITLKCLEKMGVSTASARLAACVGTNLNNDGITLYEAMAALFLAQALGKDLSLVAQFQVVLASIMAGAGIAGIPEAGLIVLPLVLSTAGLSAETIAVALPLLIPVDWIIARARSGVNVMSDMLVAILLDAGQKLTDE
ncbi:dicarboxylate/amino acid:cation symporter [Armatimonas sp.]|uniref:dicarboxylate/amino acid:cation symporter n=1 Tax=Armatimonas sp. TaxID=1872638 RepID=UPI0037527361